ncbi:MAG: hypothetical protein WCL56_11220 [Sediminibacterium sp.]
MSTLVSFISNRPGLTKQSKSVPLPIIKTIPDWYRKADRFAKMPNGEYYKANSQICPVTKEGTTDDYGKIPTWKACPAIFDIMGTGYSLNTPCDLEFFINDSGTIDCKVLDKQFEDFIQQRAPMAQFVTPHGYHDYHFAFWVHWNIVLPEGYSAIYMSPANRYELPFITSQGIVDNDSVNISGTFPFWVRNNFVGVVPAGTPFSQIIPFKREDWKSEIIIEDYNKMYKKNVNNSEKYRVPDGGVYKNEIWKQRKYE